MAVTVAAPAWRRPSQRGGGNVRASGGEKPPRSPLDGFEAHFDAPGGPVTSLDRCVVPAGRGLSAFEDLVQILEHSHTRTMREQGRRHTVTQCPGERDGDDVYSGGARKWRDGEKPGRIAVSLIR